MLPEVHHGLKPVLPPTARARTMIVEADTRSFSTIRRARVKINASCQVLPPSVLICT